VDDLLLIQSAAAEVDLVAGDLPEVRRTEVEVAGGDRLSALVWGDGPPEFVFLHGGSQNAHTWDVVALLLGRPCVAIDLPGHGQSSWRADGTYDPRVMCNAVAEAIEHLASPPVLLVGMSLGGLTAIALTARFPALVEGLVVVDVTPSAGDQLRLPHHPRPAESFASVDEMVERVYQGGTGRTRESFRRGVVANSRQRADGRWVWRWDPAKTASRHRIEWGHAWSDLGLTRAPLLFVRAGSSRVVRDEDIAQLTRRRPDVELVEIAGAVHSVQGSRPRELAGALARFRSIHHRSVLRDAPVSSPAMARASRSTAQTVHSTRAEPDGEALAERGDKISEILARQIVRDIGRQHLPPGSMLPPEATMLERFRVGRASLREALRILETYGLITIKPGPGGGPVVREVTAKEFARTSTFYFHLHGGTLGDLLEARRAMEPLMARLAAGRRDRAALAKFTADFTASREAFERGDDETGNHLVGEFHAEIAGASGNRILDLFGQSLRELYSERLESRMIGRNDSKKVIDEHQAIHDAIVEGRADDAERLMAAHMATFERLSRKAIPGLLDDVLDWR
jgi:DNA-binding FadR family transcriptional regulator/pimeloyl-ACP methyl ester carboxylesterase